jgi:hypothetical protein
MHWLSRAVGQASPTAAFVKMHDKTHERTFFCEIPFAKIRRYAEIIASNGKRVAARKIAITHGTLQGTRNRFSSSSVR